MAGLNLLAENLIQDADFNVLTGSENVQFPLKNIKNNSPSIKFRSTGNTIEVQIDLKQTRTLSAVAITGDPHGVFGVTTAKIQTSVTTDFSASPDINLDISADHGMGYAFFTEVSHRFVKLTLTGTGSFAEIGTMFIGELINIPQNSLSLNTFEYAFNDQSTVQRNRHGQVFVDERPMVKTLGGDVEFANRAEQETLDDLLTNVARKKPIWMFVDPESDGMNDGQFKLSIYGYAEREVVWRASGGNHYSIGIQVRQAM